MYIFKDDRDNLVGIAGCCGPGFPGIKSRCGRDIQCHPEWHRDPPKLLYSRYRIFLGDKTAGAWRWPHTSFLCRVANGLALFLHRPSVPARACIGWHFCKIKSYRIKLAIKPCVHNGPMGDTTNSTVTRLWTKRPSNGDSIPGRQKRFLSS